jgi:Uma2 family endonuclease
MATVPCYFEKKAVVPPLRHGDHLTPLEFMRRYEAMPEVNKAELIEGKVYMPSPVSCEEHGAPHFDLIWWLGMYRFATPGLRGGDNATVMMDYGDNVPQPDALLWIVGGQCSITEDGYLRGGPDLAAEIAASSVSYDLHEKLEAYQRNGVREYIVWRVEDRAVDWFGLRQGKLKRLRPSADGILKSKVFPGLWLDPEALVRGNLNRLVDVLQQGIASPEHAKFVNKLKRNQSRKK